MLTSLVMLGSLWMAASTEPWYTRLMSFSNDSASSRTILYQRVSSPLCGYYSVALCLTQWRRDANDTNPLQKGKLKALSSGLSTAKDIIEAAQEEGAAFTALVETAPEGIETLPLPAIGILEATEDVPGHYFVFWRRSGGYTQIIDYPHQVLWVRTDELKAYDDRWKGKCIIQKPADSAPSRNHTSSYCTGLVGGFLLLGGLSLLKRFRFRHTWAT